MGEGKPMLTDIASRIRIRHQKCDEAKPTCSSCRKGGWSCQYPDPLSSPSSSGTASPVPVEARPANNNLAVARVAPRVGRQPASFVSSMTSDELMDLDHFRRVNIPTYERFDNRGAVSGVFGTLLLQAAFTEPCVRYSALAITILFRASGGSGAPPSDAAARTRSLANYGRSIRELVLVHRRPPDLRNASLVLMCSLIFTSTELSLGDFDRALMHVMAASRILKELGMTTESSSSSSSPDGTPGQEGEGGAGEVAMLGMGCPYKYLSTALPTFPVLPPERNGTVDEHIAMLSRPDVQEVANRAHEHIWRRLAVEELEDPDEKYPKIAAGSSP